jgi:hypothetical protein
MPVFAGFSTFFRIPEAAEAPKVAIIAPQTAFSRGFQPSSIRNSRKVQVLQGRRESCLRPGTLLGHAVGVQDRIDGRQLYIPPHREIELSLKGKTNCRLTGNTKVTGRQHKSWEPATEKAIRQQKRVTNHADKSVQQLPELDPVRQAAFAKLASYMSGSLPP